MSIHISGPPAGVAVDHLDLARFGSRARWILRELGHARSELSIALVDDAEIASLNGVHRGQPRATDVLSYSLLEGDHTDFRGTMLGDVVISVVTARRQARKRHRALDEEMARLLIHGVLHLVGHDHVKLAERRVMRAEEGRLWRLLQP